MNTRRADPCASYGSSASASTVASTNGSTKPGWSKYGRTLSTTGAPGTCCTASNRFSRYCRQPEYEEYAAVTNASARRTPSAAMVRTASTRYGSQLRLPQ